jgi:hypothetical protein
MDTNQRAVGTEGWSPRSRSEVASAVLLLLNLCQLQVFGHFKIATEFLSGRYDGLWPMNLSTHSMNHFILGASV